MIKHLICPVLALFVISSIACQQNDPKLSHEWAMEASRQNHELAMKMIDQSNQRRATAPYSLKLSNDGRPILVVSAPEHQEYLVDLPNRTLIPSTRPTQ